ncbi:MAG: GGDEF domain-containing protein, partial [Methylophagaceae bacterium]
MRNFLISLGALKAVLLITAISIITSLIVTALTLWIFHSPPEITVPSYIIATIVPLIVAPIISSILVQQFLKIHLLEVEMRDLATTDFLSGLLMRQTWLTQVEQSLTLAKRQKYHCAILMIDLDDFKHINDKYGHAAGDQVIISFGKIVQRIARKSDLKARFGGEEFALLLPETTLEQAQQFSQRLHNGIRKTLITSAGKTITFTASIGISIYTPDNFHDIDQLLSQADTAL